MRLQSILRCALAGAVGCGFLYTAEAAEAADFKKTVEITLNSSLGSGTVAGIPALVKLNEKTISGFKYGDFSLQNGGDLMFTDADGNAIPHEVDTWDASGESLVWVRLPSTAANTKIVMYYGNGATSSAASSEVWSDYTGVWHLNGLATEPDTSLTQSQGVYANSTATEGIDGHLSIASIPGEKGCFGSCFRSNDSTDKDVGNYKKGGVWVKDAGDNSPLDADGTFTISGWFKHQNWDWNWDNMFYKRTSSGSGDAFAIEHKDKGKSIIINVRGGGGTVLQPNHKSMDNRWSYFTFVYEGTTCAVYQDGELLASGAVGKATDNNDPLVFGNNITIATTGTGNCAWNGWIDEVRFAKAAKSAAFVAAEYAAMNTSDADVFDYGAATDVVAETAAADPKIAPESGTMFYPTTNVTLTCKTKDATIRYTLDGTDPTTESAVYENPIDLSETTTVKARAFKEGLDPSAVVSATFTYTEPVAPAFGEVTVKPQMKTAKFYGTVASLGNLYATACDVYLAIGTSADVLGEPVKVASGVTGAFACTISELTGSTAYYYTLKIVNNATTAMSAETSGSFTTLDTDVIKPEATPALTRQAIQEAIDDAATETAPGTVTLGDGLFEIDAQLMVTNGVTLVGQGSENTIIRQTQAPGANTRVVTLDDGAKLERVTLTGGCTGAAWHNGVGAAAHVKNGTISWCCITNNASGASTATANNLYGGIVSFYEGQGQVDHTIIANNVAGAVAGNCVGGAIGIRNPTGPVLVDTCLIYGNSVTGKGGAIGADFGGSHQLLTVRNTTMANNAASGEGGGVYVSQYKATKYDFALVNSILANNTEVRGDTTTVKGDANFAHVVSNDATADYWSNYAAQSSGNVFANGTPALGEGSKSVDDVKFGHPANGNYRLHRTSPAIGAGDWYEGIAVDLDGKERKNPKTAAGCYEFVGDPTRRNGLIIYFD